MLERSSDSTAGLNFTRNAIIASTDANEERANEIFLPVLIGWSLRVSRLAKLVMLMGRPVGACITVMTSDVAWVLHRAGSYSPAKLWQ